LPFDTFRDLRWRLSTAEPRCRTLLTWSLKLSLSGTAFFLLLALTLFPRLPWSVLPVTALMGLGFSTGLALTGAALSPMPFLPLNTAGEVSAVHDVRWTRLYPVMLMIATLLTLLSLSALAAHPAPLPAVLQAMSGLWFVTLVLIVPPVGGNALLTMLRDLPPPRTRTASSSIRASGLRPLLTVRDRT